MTDIDTILARHGIHCPICGMQLIDLQHDGYNGDDPHYHEYYCTKCHLTIEITNEEDDKD